MVIPSGFQKITQCIEFQLIFRFNRNVDCFSCVVNPFSQKQTSLVPWFENHLKPPLFSRKKTWMVPIITGNTIIHRKILVVVWKFPSQTHSESKWVAAIHQEPSGNLRVCYWKWMKMAHRNSWFTYFTSKKWWLSIVMLVYQRVNLHFPIVFPEFSYDFPIKTSVSPAPRCHIPAGRLRWLVPSPCYSCDRRTWMTGDHGTWMTCFI